MKKFITAALLCAAVITMCVFTGCKGKSKKTADQSTKILDVQDQSDHVWYYFTQDGFAQTDLPENSPLFGSLPYTEAVRISSAGNAVNANDENGNKAYALVNRLGVLCFEGEKISLAKDISVFSDRTAANLVFVNDTPVFSVYKSAFFNGTIDSAAYKKDSGSHYFLIQFDDKSKISYPIINGSNIFDAADYNVDNSYEVTDYFWDGKTWYCSLKSLPDSEGKTSFSYLKFQPAAPLLSISPVTASNLITVKESNVNEFRNAMHIMDYSIAPERIRKMLKGFSDEIIFNLEVKSAGGTSPRLYENIPPAATGKELSAKAIISQSWSAALFEDGTLFIEGALPGKHILRGGKPVAIRLPKLSDGYVYSDFVISGTTLYAAWEQTDFYKIIRSGFLSVDLDSTLYSIIR